MLNLRISKRTPFRTSFISPFFLSISLVKKEATSKQERNNKWKRIQNILLYYLIKCLFGLKQTIIYKWKRIQNICKLIWIQSIHTSYSVVLRCFTVMNVLEKQILSKLLDDLWRDLRFFNLHKRLFFCCLLSSDLDRGSLHTLRHSCLPSRQGKNMLFLTKNIKKFFASDFRQYIPKAELKFCNKETKTANFD